MRGERFFVLHHLFSQSETAFHPPIPDKVPSVFYRTSKVTSRSKKRKPAKGSVYLLQGGKSCEFKKQF